MKLLFADLAIKEKCDKHDIKKTCILSQFKFVKHLYIDLQHLM